MSLPEHTSHIITFQNPVSTSYLLEYMARLRDGGRMALVLTYHSFTDPENIELLRDYVRGKAFVFSEINTKDVNLEKWVTQNRVLTGTTSQPLKKQIETLKLADQSELDLIDEYPRLVGLQVGEITTYEGGSHPQVSRLTAKKISVSIDLLFPYLTELTVDEIDLDVVALPKTLTYLNIKRVNYSNLNFMLDMNLSLTYLPSEMRKDMELILPRSLTLRFDTSKYSLNNKTRNKTLVQKCN
jgi:hypothetical protein